MLSEIYRHLHGMHYAEIFNNGNRTLMFYVRFLNIVMIKYRKQTVMTEAYPRLGISWTTSDLHNFVNIMQIELIKLRLLKTWFMG